MWSNPLSWVEAQVPTSSDDVVAQLGGLSGPLTIDAGAVCKSASFGNYDDVLTHNADATLTVGGTGVGSFTLVSGMTYTLGNSATSAIVFQGTTGGDVITAGKTLGNVTIASGSGSYLLINALTASTVTLTSGELGTNGQTCTWVAFSSSNSFTRTLTLGASAITITGTGTAWTFLTNTGLTLSAGTSTVTFTGAGVTCQPGGATHTWNNMVASGSGTFTLGQGFNGANFTRTGTAVKTDILQLNSTLTCSGTLTLNSNSLTNRLLVQSNTVGTTRTITAATLVCTNVIDFMDITGAGAATWTTAASGATAFGNALGNSGITFTTPVTRYAVVAGNGSAIATWSTTSGGAGGASVPLPQDTMIFDANSAAGTYTMDMPRLGADITCTGFTRTLAVNSVANSMYGSLTLDSGMTLTSGSLTLTFRGRTTHTLTSAGITFGSAYALIITAPSGTYTLADALANSAAGTSMSLQVTNGTFNSSGFAITMNGLESIGTATRTVDLSSSTFTLRRSGTFNVVNLTSTGLTFLAGTSTLLIAPTDSGVTKTFNGAGLTFATVSYTNSSTATLTITGANTFASFVNSGAVRTIIWPASGVNHVVNWAVDGTVSNLISIVSSSAGTKADISRAIQDAQGNIWVFNGFNASLVHAPDNVQFPGTSGMTAETIDKNSLDVLGDLQMIVCAKMDDWTPGADNQSFMGKWTNVSGTKSYVLGVRQVDGFLSVDWSVDGATNTFAQTTSAPAIANGAHLWIKCELDVDNGAAGRTVRFYTSIDPVTTDPTAVNWILFETVVQAGVTSIFNSATPLLIGGHTGATDNIFAGKIYYAEVRNGIGGTVVASPDFRDGYKNIQSKYLSIQDIRATGRGWWAAANSTNVSGNTGWNFGYAMWIGGGMMPSSPPLSFAFSRVFQGSISPSSSVIRSVLRSLDGSTTFQGSLFNTVVKGFAGQISPSGSLMRTALHLLQGSTSPSGQVANRNAMKVFSGLISPQGDVGKAVSRRLEGLIDPSGELMRSPSLSFQGSIAPSGLITRREVDRIFSALMGPIGNLLIFEKEEQILVGPLYAIVLDNNLISAIIVNPNPSDALVRHVIGKMVYG